MAFPNKNIFYVFIIVKGKSEEPVYIRISNETVEIKDAKQLWGLETFQTERELLSEYPSSYVACIGPTGEKMLKFAHINTELNYIGKLEETD